MKITSSAFQNNQSIPAKYSCDGEDVNPPLTFSELPDNTQSLVLIMDDPDAPAGTWVHWTIWNINPTTTEIAENSVPEGAVEGITSSGSAGYGGPCPPSGEHRYIFKLYALDAMLELDASADKAALEQEMQSYILGKADLTGLYRRQ
ncbi:MAG: YbhB/YbcL family Raf kinase inhibitor-like protein [Candidatus Kerfeldbacteria bacterium CG08_land_8_20_14_0_20_40_16]|uniref:YbhB/YbcL family Raf kinase inhibitor-like protein n=1 Tax=Candidatus Kerfeldbacteria bacterium CG08_land_8_20_14_0_20_40_16 TaxID=2014244 RepID=A0A2H0YW90_9BACT|nr:MAG: YbhB/YbcL family Raf kinase inhibitor-like protein [Candidatus Kerfeldbacteria bacterium CG08_land_8_20_14_0_20_40_16]